LQKAAQYDNCNSVKASFIFECCYKLHIMTTAKV